MAPSTDPDGTMSQSTRNALAAVRQLIPQRRFAEACAVLRQAREAVRIVGNLDDELFLTSMLVSYLSVSGEAEAALNESEEAERRSPTNRGLVIQTIRQMIRMKRYSDAVSRCRQLIAEASLGAADRHEAVASLGESLFAHDQAAGSSELLEALRIARESGLDPVYWNRTLALRLARDGQQSGVAYLEALRDTAMRSGDEATVEEVENSLAELRR